MGTRNFPQSSHNFAMFFCDAACWLNYSTGNIDMLAMQALDSFSLIDARAAEDGTEPSPSTVSQSLYREVEMIGKGVGGAVVETIRHPEDKLAEFCLSASVGIALGAASRLGAPGRAVSFGIGTAMLAKLGYDELTGSRWSNLGAAVKDAWLSGDNMQANIDATQNSLGSFLIDTAIGYASGKTSSLVLERIAPPANLVKFAISNAERDSGKALLRLQNRWENPSNLRSVTDGRHELVTYSESALPGTARGDLVNASITHNGDVLLVAMDVEGHSVGAAKKAVAIHAALDEALPAIRKHSASDVLTMIDRKLSPKDELSVTAGMMLYNPKTHNLQTATASSELAYVVRANGQVRQLDAELGGLPLGVDLYANSRIKGNESIDLNLGDTVVMASDGAFDRLAYGNSAGFKSFLEKIGPDPHRIRDAIIKAPEPRDGADDISFLIFHRR